MKCKLGIMLCLGLVFAFTMAMQVGASGYSRSGGCYGGPFYQHTDMRIPYFALHPPVYYSYPVPRTYGYSPYAYGPNVTTPTLKRSPQPEIIPNPHVKPKAKSQATANRTASLRSTPGPQVIFNPYVEQPAEVASTPVSR